MRPVLLFEYVALQRSFLASELITIAGTFLLIFFCEHILCHVTIKRLS